MRVGYFDCFSGAAGDMILGALIDAGLPLAVLESVVARLHLPGVSLAAEKAQRHGIAVTHVRVNVEPGSQKAHRHLPEIERIIAAADLPGPVTDDALRIFRRLAEAEAAVHGTPIEKVHFHEVGAADAIVDVVGACAGLRELGVERVLCSPIPTGSGQVTCHHGVMPVPAPATARLLEGAPLAACAEPGELTTPTGAAILTTLADAYGPPPTMTLRAVGYGAGTRQGQTRPNFLRLLLGDETGRRDDADRDTVLQLETQVDDATAQSLSFALERLLESGALDAFLTPIVMKKGRPGALLTVLARAADADGLEAILFAETGTLGVRRRECQRTTLRRRHESVCTPFGEVRVKVSERDGAERAWPEYEDCAAAARKAGVSLRSVQEAALAAWAQQTRPE